ncbi:MAPEG family protein [Nostoc sp. CENA67]|uniref:MAPEG family protein n=1 Tax=Amazonocrinis nigriterrae CENA67 TaxID=2794033 RepID=A0A8J7HTB5_9NOST|nr:MAPEG family protein [Amazonocrinis nigriterrae]MBH8565526.1 MAPEG family protein [Amazonocrinis nigriterrae CENA67]
MTPDLICLLILALWSIPLNHIPALARVAYSDISWGMGNREKMPDVPPWVERADRAQRNHHDNLAMIAVVIFTAQITGQSDKITAIASIVIVVSRILHGLVYIFGIIGIRSLAYLVAVLAMLAIVWRILT